jgi:hypothetical protein
MIFGFLQSNFFLMGESPHTYATGSHYGIRMIILSGFSGNGGERPAVIRPHIKGDARAVDSGQVPG